MEHDVWGWFVERLGDAAVVGLLLSGLAWFCREWITQRLTASLKLDTEKKLQQFKARLDAAEAETASIRQAGIDANLQIGAVVSAERVAAIKAVWNGVIEWKRATMVSTVASAMDAKYIHDHGGDEKTKAFMKANLDSLQYLDLLKAMNALQQWRPFVTERAWALFAAYHGFYVARLLRAVPLMLGDTKMALRILELSSELQIVRATAPPLIVQAFETNAVGTTVLFLAFVEEELLAELRRSLAGEHSGPEASRQAAQIVAAVNGVLSEVAKGPSPVAAMAFGASEQMKFAAEVLSEVSG